MPLPLKQSVLPFFSPPKKTALSKTSAAADAIVIDDSDDDDGFHTPPPEPIKAAKKSSGIVVELIVDQPKSSKGARSTISAAGKDKEVDLPQKKAATQKKRQVDGDNEASSSSSSRLTKEEAQKAKEVVSESILCHQHRQPCSTLLRCTRLKPDGNRCPNKYCYSSLQRIYKQDAQQIVKAGRNILGVSPDDHVGPEVSSYLWKCPRCKGACQCSACRKRLGLEPLGGSKTSKKSAGKEAGDSSASASTSKRLAEDEVNGIRKTKKTAVAIEVVVPGVANDHKEQSTLESEGAIKTPPPEQRHLEPTEEVGIDTPVRSQMASGSAEPMHPQLTSVSAEALRARVIPDPRGPSTSTTQSLLFKSSFSDRQVQPKPKMPLQQQVFQRPLRKPKAVDMPTLDRIETRLPVANIMERVWLYESLVRFDWFKIPKTILSQLDRFDEWTESQMQTILERLICSIADISSIKTNPNRSVHKRLVEAFRETGEDLGRGEAWEVAREYCLTKDVRIAELENVEPLSHQRGRECKSRNSKWTRDDTLMEGRQTRSRRLAETQALDRVKKISMEEVDSSEESESSDNSTAETSVDEASEDEAPKGPRRSRRGLRKSARQRSKVVKRASISDSEDDADLVAGHQSNGRDRSESIVAVFQEEMPLAPLPAPPFEQRVAILSSMVDVLMQSKQVNEEITFGFKQALELEKAGKEEEKELLRKQEEELFELDRAAPSMTMVEEFCQWKDGKHELMKEHAFAFLDLRVSTHLQIELHKSRCEALGVDSDGNEYWHLSEYVETKPQDTNGRWAWSLLVLGNTLGKTKDVERQSSTALQPIEVESSRVSGNVSPLVPEGSQSARVDGEAMEIDPPIQKSNSLPVGKDSIQTTEGDSQVQLSQDGKLSARYFSGTSDHHIIAQLQDYIRYRLSLQEVEEQQDYRRKMEAEETKTREAAVALAVERGDFNAQGSGSMGGSMLLAPGERRSHTEKTLLKEKQKDRRTQVEALLKKLDMVRDYYKWHEYDES